MDSNGTAHLVMMEQTQQALRVFISDLLQRYRFTNLAGLTHNGARDIYEICGYPRRLTYEEYRAEYERGGIAARIINAFPAATWRNPPKITEKDKKDESRKSPFEDGCDELIRRRRLWHACERVDRLASLGRYAVLLVGVRGQTDLEQPLQRVPGPESLAYLATYSEEHAKVIELEGRDVDTFGMPTMYRIDFTRGGSFQEEAALRIAGGGAWANQRNVHASRIIHVAENGLEDDLIGTPRLRPVWNYLKELEKVVGGSGEMFWRDAKGRFNLALREGAYLSPEDAASLEDKVQEMVHGLRDMIQTSGIDLTKLVGTVADPSQHIDKILDLIAGTLQIPKRLLVGSERGELSSSQDENNWGDITIARQLTFGEPMLVRPFFDLAIRIGAVPMPRSGIDGYILDWPDPKPLTQLEDSLIALNRVKVFQTYASVSDRSIEEILPPEVLYKEIVGYDEEQITRILELAAKYAEEREQADAEERAAQEAAMQARGAPQQILQEEL